MKNKYIINENIISLILINRKGIIQKSYVDLDDFEKINSYENTFFASYRKNVNKYYCCITVYVGVINGKPKYKTKYLHKIIMDIEDEENTIDHIDHDTLNNTKNNLRVSKIKNNSRNRIGANINNKIGYRNICQNKDKLLVQLQVDGKNKLLKTFAIDELNDAIIFANEMRKKYYGEYSGNA